VDVTAEEHLARALTNVALADRLDMLSESLRVFKEPFREALLREAGRRLRLPSSKRPTPVSP